MIYDRISTLHEFLNEAEMRTIPGGAVKSWLKKLEDVAFDADNVLDELNHHLLSKQIKPIKPMKEKSINNEATELGLVGRLADVPPTLVDAAFETDAFTIDPIFIGRDEVVSEIADPMNV
ncbi:hypothetical protein SASPL_146146 [Salvia splendens]|uniref:Disease resistance N-terminal domain-containing protein n=1 Tax=Salvia splendens TaxID=180675 RepID=A0A8X8Z8A7_SALSN|nr:hypothetical protein SASPL_146146 [Salvia splendens]